VSGIHIGGKTSAGAPEGTSRIIFLGTPTFMKHGELYHYCSHQDCKVRVLLNHFLPRTSFMLSPLSARNLIRGNAHGNGAYKAGYFSTVESRLQGRSDGSRRRCCQLGVETFLAMRDGPI
jgi:hypothetical protein